LKKQLAEKPKQPTGIGDEKFQGPPKPQSEEQQQKRLERGVNVRKVGSKKGIIQSKGEQVIEETIVEPVSPQQLEITVRAEKSEPQKVEVVLKEPEKSKDDIELTKRKLENEKKKEEILKNLEGNTKK